MTSLSAAVENIFSENGLLSNALSEYEKRPGQLMMARAIGQVLESAGNSQSVHDDFTMRKAQMLAVEAETGIGKTLAYLVPACLSGLKVIVSTGTLNLQEQILHKEIPFIRKHIMPELKAICVKGRRNYACLFRAKQFLSTPQMQLYETGQEQELLLNWLEQTKTGDRAELNWLPDDSLLWHQLSSSSDKCLGLRCPDNASCFISTLRKKAGASQVIIVNHHLFFSDLALRRFGHAEILPRYQAVIFDEAHHIENISTRYFGTTFSHFQLLDLVKDIETLARENLIKENALKTIQIAQTLATQANIFANIFPKQKGRYPLPEIIEECKEWNKELAELTAAITGLERHLHSPALDNEMWDTPKRRCTDLLEGLQIITTDIDSSSIYWCERRERTITLSASPIEVSPDLQEHLYSKVQSIIFTSATLKTGDTFSYMFNRLGLNQDTETLSLASPFDYEGRTKVYIPHKDFPEPNSPLFLINIQEQTLEILNASRGRALLLFTSFSGMRHMHEFLYKHLTYPILMQGDMPKNTLLESFHANTKSVLLAVASFWEGVNVPGESLSCVIIDKLPFEVPSDPVIMARINKIKDERGNPFFDFQVPRAILSLRQGLGRLMRSSADSGLLAVMDVRLYTKGYGKSFLKSMPKSPVIRSLKEVHTFFDQF